MGAQLKALWRIELTPGYSKREQDIQMWTGEAKILSISSWNPFIIVHSCQTVATFDAAQHQVNTEFASAPESVNPTAVKSIHP